MKIELLYHEVCHYFGDYGNALLLKQALPEAEFAETKLLEEPLFVSEVPSLLYMGATTESKQALIIEKLYPYKARLRQLMEMGVPMLFTGNAGEILFEKIKLWDGRETEGLGLLPMTAERKQYTRFNALFLGKKDALEIVGFQSTFDTWRGDVACPMAEVVRGYGDHPQSKTEGLRQNNVFVTQLLGPMLVLNPLFTENLLRLMGVPKPTLPHRDALMAAYTQRCADFKDPSNAILQ